ncbi:TonB-dependent siderophore receptor [Gloeocapsopsis sp. IPPAS B-1203]|nr:TonB-dependent siderophore receptor [Gloeocapsopsis sp. IPPAS B-1203]
MSPVLAQEEQLANRSHQLGNKQPATTVEEWLAQIEASIVQITNVCVEATEEGLQVILETAEGELSVPETRTVGNALTLEIPNARIAQEYFQENAIAGIASVNVTQLPGDQVRVAITGTDAPPVAEVTAEARGLVLAVTLGEVGEVTEEDTIEIVVTGEQDEGYNPSNATTATRTDTPLRDIPQSIQVVPRQVLEDRNVTDLVQAVETVSGIVDGGRYNLIPAGGYTIRGFTQSGNFRNGFRDTDFYSLTGLSTIEQVEILRGPASVLYGAVEPGGIINVITRQPLSEPYYNLSFEARSYNFYQPSIDLSGPVDEEETVLYRFIASYQNAGSYQDFVNTSFIEIAPSITFRLSDQTDLNFYYEYMRFSADPPLAFSSPSGRWAFSNGSLVTRTFFPSYPDIHYSAQTVHRLGYTFSHEFSDNWQIRNNLAVLFNRTEENTNIPTALVDDRFFEIIGEDREFTIDNYFGQVDLLGKFDTGTISHQLLLGFDFNRYVNYFRVNSFNLPNLDINNPNYVIPIPEYDITPLRFSFGQSYGVYLQDQISLLDNLKLLIGGRFDWASSGGEESDTLNNDAFSPRVGLVYQPSDTVSLYASYSRSFVPSFSRNPDDELFVPTRGTQYEVGVKADFLERRLSTILSAYEITKTNVITADPDPVRAVQGFSVQVGEQRSRGVEFNTIGEILPGWNIIVSYAYTDAAVTEDNSILVGDQPAGVPEHQASLWTTYKIQDGALEGLGFGLGLFYVGARPVDLPNTFEASSYLRTDAAIYYRRGRFNGALNIRNLFDADYSYGTAYLFRSDPRAITGSISWEF